MLQPGQPYPVVWEKPEEWYVSVEINGKPRNVLVPKSAAAQVTEQQLATKEPLNVDTSQQYAILRQNERLPRARKSRDEHCHQTPRRSRRTTCA